MAGEGLERGLADQVPPLPSFLVERCAAGALHTKLRLHWPSRQSASACPTAHHSATVGWQEQWADLHTPQGCPAKTCKKTSRHPPLYTSLPCCCHCWATHAPLEDLAVGAPGYMPSPLALLQDAAPSPRAVVIQWRQKAAATPPLGPGLELALAGKSRTWLRQARYTARSGVAGRDGQTTHHAAELVHLQLAPQSRLAWRRWCGC